MSEMEEKLGAILSNPQMMQQIMSMAQAMSPPPEPQGRPEQPPEPAPPALPDFSVMQKLAGMTRQSGIDKNQQALLRALSPYISRERSAKLEKAMRAAKMARLASAFLNAGQIGSVVRTSVITSLRIRKSVSILTSVLLKQAFLVLLSNVH